jgi:hypothetical protein
MLQNLSASVSVLPGLSLMTIVLGEHPSGLWLL